MSQKPSQPKGLRRWLTRDVTRSDRRQARFLGHADFLEERGPPGSLTSAIYVIVILVFSGVLWAYFTEFDKATQASGQVMPSGSIRQVQHLEGGIISHIPVKEGDSVEAGQLVMALDQTASRADLDRTEAELAALSLRAERLRAFIEDRDPDFSAFPRWKDSLVEDQLAILRHQREAQWTQIEILKSQAAERRAELESREKRRQTAVRQVNVAAEELKIRQTLVQKRLMPRVLLLETQRIANDARADLQEMDGAILALRQSIAEIENRTLEVKVRLRNDAVGELGEITAQLAQTMQTAENLRDRLVRNNITSPVNGVVKSLLTRTVGGVIPPGAVIMEIVPIDDELVVEAQILPDDISQLAVGQIADIRIAGFDQARFGSILGVLETLSPSTNRVEGEEPYYRAVIRLDQNFVGDDPAENHIVPGMSVQASIRNGSHTLIQYLLKPVYRAFDIAFSER